MKKLIWKQYQNICQKYIQQIQSSMMNISVPNFQNMWSFMTNIFMPKLQAQTPKYFVFYNKYTCLKLQWYFSKVYSYSCPMSNVVSSQINLIHTKTVTSSKVERGQETVQNLVLCLHLHCRLQREKNSKNIGQIYL